MVATGGCFDLLHRGHVSLLSSARSLGDALIVYSDGLVEQNDDWVELADLLTGVDGSASAADLVSHLLDQAPAPPTDDVTVLVLRRQPDTV